MPLSPRPPKGRSLPTMWVTVSLRADAARARGAKHTFLCRAVLGEKVERQRRRPVAQQRQRIVQRGELQHRQDRPKDFLLHHRGVGRDIGQNRRCEVEIVRIVLAAVAICPVPR